MEITNILLENGANVNTRSYCVPIRRGNKWIRDDENQCSALIAATIHRHF